MEKIYLDVCCLNRPFDDQSQDRIRLEAHAVGFILKGVEEEHFSWYGSEAVFDEIESTSDFEKRNAMNVLCRDMSELVPATELVVVRGYELMDMGFTLMDALHIASCESAQVDVLLTTDDKMMKRAQKLRKNISVKVENPVVWIEENRY